MSEEYPMIVMVDLALRSPEVGAVNFSILHTVLSRLLHELKLDQVLCSLQTEFHEMIPHSEFHGQSKSQKRQSPNDSEDKVKDAALSILLENELDKEKPVHDVKTLTEEDVLQSDPGRVVQEMWQAVNVSNRLKRVEEQIGFLCEKVDQMRKQFREVDVLTVKSLNMNKRLQNTLKEQKEVIFKLEKENKEFEDRIFFLESKVNKEDLSCLYEPGFLDNLLSTQENLRAFVEDLQTQAQNTANCLQDQERLINREIRSLRASQDTLDNSVTLNASKIDEQNKSLETLEKEKVSESELSLALKTKADIDVVLNSVDKEEFVAAVQDIRKDMKILDSSQKFNEEQIEEVSRRYRHELSLKMYTEDFIVATEPIRNRIKALIYEQQKIKEIALNNYIPAAPGTTQCFTCKRPAALTDPIYLDTEKEKQMMECPSVIVTENADDRLPIPPHEQTRLQDAALLPVLFANMTPLVGLQYYKTKKSIDNEIEAFFKPRTTRKIGGRHA